MTIYLVECRLGFFSSNSGGVQCTLVMISMIRNERGIWSVSGAQSTINQIKVKWLKDSNALLPSQDETGEYPMVLENGERQSNQADVHESSSGMLTTINKSALDDAIAFFTAFVLEDDLLQPLQDASMGRDQGTGALPPVHHVQEEEHQ